MDIIFSILFKLIFLSKSQFLCFLHCICLCFVIHSPVTYPFVFCSLLCLCIFPSLFLLSSPKSRTFLSLLFPSGIIVPSAIVIGATQISCFSCNLFLDNFMYTLTVEAGRNIYGLLLVSRPPLPDTLCFISSLHQTRRYC